MDDGNAVGFGNGVAPTEGDVRRVAAVSDPVIRNLQITQAYHDLSSAMSRLTGPGANWCTVATWASKQAGQSIRGEDLVAAFDRLLNELTDAENSASTLLETATEVSGYQMRSLGGALAALWDAISPAAAFERASEAVARGNRKVFVEIAALFARFMEFCQGAPPSDDALQAFLDGVRPGDPPDGQRLLRQAFTHYRDAMRMQDAKDRAELLLLANLEVGFHEQTRLQPEIVEAMNAPVVNPAVLRRRLVEELFPDPRSRVRYWLSRVAGRMAPFLRARDELAEQVQAAGRQVVTATLMTLTLPRGRVLQLGNSLPDRFPDVLTVPLQPELVALLHSVDLGSDAAVEDWGDLRQRMHFIANLFRTCHFADDLYDPPYSTAQVSAIRAGRRPAGPL